MIDIIANALNHGPVMHLAAKTTSTTCPGGVTPLANGLCPAPTPNKGGISAAMTSVRGLLASAGNGIMGLGGVGGGLMIGYHALMRNMSGGDQSADAQHLSAMKKVGVGTVLVVCAGAIAHFGAHAL